MEGQAKGPQAPNAPSNAEKDNAKCGFRERLDFGNNADVSSGLARVARK